MRMPGRGKTDRIPTTPDDGHSGFRWTSSSSSLSYSFSAFLLPIFIYSILLILLPSPSIWGSVSGESDDEGVLIIDISNTTVVVDQQIYVNMTLNAENNTGDVSLYVRDPYDLPVLVESSALKQGNASFVFALFSWYSNGTYIVNATARTADNRTYNATGVSFEFVNWTKPEPVDDEPDDGPFPIPAPMLLVVGLTTAFVLMGYSTEKGKFGFWLFIIPLYTRLKKSEALEDFNRGQIYRTIAENPGIRYSEIREKVGIGNGVLTYHLKVLQSMKYVKAIGDKTYKRFYLWGAAETLPPNLDKPFTPIQKSIVDYLHSNNWTTQGEISEALKIKQQTVSKNLKKLEQANIVRRVKEVSVYRYNLTEGYLHWLGRQISPKCPTCMNECRIGAKFCENCGTKLK